jgi:Protein of unknown function (DUF1217)
VLSTTQRFKQISGQLPQSLNAIASKSQVKREVKYYLDHISKIKTIDDFIGDRRLFAFAMKAFGLEDMTYAKAFVRKALAEGTDNANSFANRLVDPRLKEFAGTFNFARRGEYTTTFAEVKQGTVDRYVRQALEEDAGRQNEGVRLALYFERKAGTLSGPYSILADKALIGVVQTALDIPASSSAQAIEKQAAVLTEKLDLTSLKDPKKLKAFLEKFTLKWELANPSAAAAVPSLLPAATASVSSGILAALQNLKPGGR